MPANQAPQNWQQLREEQRNRYFNGYQTTINNQLVTINHANTHINLVPPAMYPQWYQPAANWQYCNGFLLGSLVNVGPSWFGWGWPSSYGVAPTGFICADDYVPTPWIYFPALGQWREAGVYSYVSGPDEDYTGPISVEVVEPIEMPGYNGIEIINQVFLYDAYYYPEFERWGYMDRHGYFIWLNI